MNDEPQRITKNRYVQLFCATHENTVKMTQKPLQTNSLHIWRIHLSADSTLYHTLSAAEKAHAHKYQLEEHQYRFIASRGTLRQILSHYLSLDPTAIHLTENEHGKPMLDPQQHSDQIFFSVSHSHDLALYAISATPNVGIDVEFMGKNINIDRVATRFFSPSESQYIHAITSPLQKTKAFLQTWTGKEAFVKAIGKGLLFPLNAFELSIQDHSMTLQHINGDSMAAKMWSLIPLEMPADYIACVAIEHPAPTVTWQTG